jgi:hypothetical protein
MIDNAATSVVEQASCLFIKGLRIIDNAATSVVEQAACLFIKG